MDRCHILSLAYQGISWDFFFFASSFGFRGGWFGFVHTFLAFKIPIVLWVLCMYV